MSDQMSMFPKPVPWWKEGLPETPPMPPYSEPTTSREAAESVRDTAPAQRERVYAYIDGQCTRGATCDEIEAALGLLHTSTSGRIWELLGTKNLPARIVKTEEKRETRNGRNARVHVTLRHYQHDGQPGGYGPTDPAGNA